MTIPKNGSLANSSQRPREREDGSVEIAYGRGRGFDDGQWAQFVNIQEDVAKRHDNAAARLRAAAVAMGSGQLTDQDRQTIRSFNTVFGRGAASPEAMQQAADRYDIASTVLRDQTNFIADGISMEEYLGLGEGMEPTGMAAMQRGGNRLWVNMDHPEIANPNLWADRLAWVLGHEPFHADGLSLADQLFRGQTGYRAGDEKQRRAYSRMRSQPSQSTVNPDHLTAFSFGLPDD